MSTCRIIRDFETNRIESVLDQSGIPSALFQQFVELFNSPEEALNAWAVSESSKFKTFNGNKPITVNSVLDYINRNLTNDTLTIEDINEANKLLISSDTYSLNDLFGKYQSTFFNKEGKFSINRDKLKSSGLYSDSEINNLIMDPTTMGDVRLFINRLNNYLKENDGFNNYIEQRESKFNIADTSQVNVLGKYATLNDDVVAQTVLNELSDSPSEEVFESKLASLSNPIIRDAIMDNPELKNQIYNFVKDSRLVPSYIVQEGTVFPKQTNDLSPAILNTVRVGELKIGFFDAINAVKRFSISDWTTRLPEIKRALKMVELEAAQNHIDIVGLADRAGNSSREEIIGLLDSIDSFNSLSETESVTSADVFNLVSDINEFFGKPMVDEFVPVSYTGKNVSVLKTNRSESSIYSDGFVKADNDIYLKVRPYDTFEDLFLSTYSALQQDVTILPDYVLGEKIVKDGKYNLGYVMNPANYAEIRQDISKNIEKIVTKNYYFDNMSEFDLYKQIALYKEALKLGQKIINRATPQSFANQKTNFTGNSEYLTSDFISDFYSRILQNKVLNSPLYNNTLQYFNIDDNGIVMTNNGASLQYEIFNNLQEHPDLYEDLKNYAILSKNQDLKFLIPVTTEGEFVENTIEDRRDFIVNNPELAKPVIGSYIELSDNSMILHNSTDEFVRKGNSIYELTNYDSGVSLYSKLTGINDINYNVLDQVGPLVEDVNLNDFKNLNSTGNSLIEIPGNVSKLKEKISCQA